MKHLCTTTLLAGITALSCLLIPLTADAHLLRRCPPVVVAQAPRAVIIPPDDYRGPDGAYGSTADMVRSIEGTPCGQACQVRSFQRWNPPSGHE